MLIITKCRGHIATFLDRFTFSAHYEHSANITVHQRQNVLIVRPATIEPQYCKIHNFKVIWMLLEVVQERAETMVINYSHIWHQNSKECMYMIIYEHFWFSC